MPARFGHPGAMRHRLVARQQVRQHQRAPAGLRRDAARVLGARVALAQEAPQLRRHVAALGQHGVDAGLAGLLPGSRIAEQAGYESPRVFARACASAAARLPRGTVRSSPGRWRTDGRGS
ncbi:hypothetical protein [Xenophilus sp. Marseille-Q4582]|uniref:hypothetical protein n=1 Tax=Xenophilus sp. Marseille-Q4582 TaxID=2866600 RepID=UPI001CE3D107|nr:hypothetical protein [Xenophilus sp. Marseille-Q4582]